MKYLLIIGDGMADNPLPELLSRTPLEYAKIPAMDALASAGKIGIVRTIPTGVQAGSDTAILSILGCDPTVYTGGRAALEAAASGIKLHADDIAYRCNMVTFEDSVKPFGELKILSHSAGGIDGETSDALIRELFNTNDFKHAADDAGMEVFPGSSFRHIAVQRGSRKPVMPLMPLIPPHDHIGEPIGQLLPQGDAGSEKLANLMRRAYEYLNKHPANIRRREEKQLPANGIWFWAQGRTVVLPDFECKYSRTGCVISAVPLCRGIGALLGLKVVDVEGATGELDTNYEGKVDAAFESLRELDFAIVHVEAPDECTHNGDLRGKLQAIEWIDSRVVAPLTARLRKENVEFRMLIMSDHRTLMSTRGHCGEPVPYLLYDSRIDNNTGLTFCEKNTEKSDILPSGTLLMGMLFNDSDI